MKKFRQVLFYLLLVSFLILAVTGILKFPELQKFFSFIYTFIPPSAVTFFHDWSGIILTLLIILHIVLNTKILTSLKKFRFKGTNLTVISGATAILVFILLISGLIRINQPIKLTSVEVKNYKGEKLGSINDFRENSIKGPQYIDKNKYRLQIAGLVGSKKTYSYAEVLNFQKYQKVVELDCVEGWSVKVLWEGIKVKDLIKDLSISPKAKTIIFYAADGYSTSFPLDYVLNNNIIVAYKMNNVVLPPERGFPFQLVAEQKWGYKWIKWITKIELSNNSNYKGYWEQRGYSNDGSLNKSQFQ